MRITNQMTTNKMLLNINRNQLSVDTLYGQMTTGKKIQMPSDDPITASRALKFRTNVSQTEQYIKNTQQGLSWMNITEQGFANTTEILKSIRDRCVEGASDQFTYDDRQKMATAIQALAAQIGSEMNIQYAGRYVFSGYRTDLPPTVETSDSSADFDITQYFRVQDIEASKSYVKTSADAAPEVFDSYRLKLPYTSVTPASGLTLTSAAGVTSSMNINTVNVNNISAYKPAAGEVNYIPETGELIFNQDDMSALRTDAAGGISITYNKKGLEAGELNPIVYFECTDNINSKSYNMNEQQLRFEFGVNTRITINNLAKDSFTANLYSDLHSLINLLNGVNLSSESDLLSKYKAAGLSDEDAAAAVKSQINEETQKYRAVMRSSFSNMLGLIDGHSSQISKEYTLLGSRMNSLELIENRLSEDRVSYTELMSKNEDVDYLEVIMNLSSAEYVYNAALKAGGSIAQISLVDFIR